MRIIRGGAQAAYQNDSNKRKNAIMEAQNDR